MADYKELLRKAVEALPENNGAARRAVYEKARAALVGQLRAIQPPLPARDITTHRLQLEDCIRQVEQESSEAVIAGMGSAGELPPPPVYFETPKPQAQLPKPAAQQATPKAPSKPTLVPREQPRSLPSGGTIEDIIAAANADTPPPAEPPKRSRSGAKGNGAANKPIPMRAAPPPPPPPPVSDEDEIYIEPEPDVLPPRPAQKQPSARPLPAIVARAEAAKNRSNSTAFGVPGGDKPYDAPRRGPSIEPRQGLMPSRGGQATARQPVIEPVAFLEEPRVAAAMSAVREVDVEQQVDPQGAIDRAIATLDREARGDNEDEVNGYDEDRPNGRAKSNGRGVIGGMLGQKGPKQSRGQAALALPPPPREAREPERKAKPQPQPEPRRGRGRDRDRDRDVRDRDDRYSEGFPRARAEAERGGMSAVTIFLLVFVVLLLGAGGAGFWAVTAGYFDPASMFRPAAAGTDTPAASAATADVSASATGPGNTAAPAEQPAPTTELATEERLTPDPALTGDQPLAVVATAQPTEERLPDAAVAANEQAVASADPASAAGSQSLLLEASDSGTTGAVPFSGTVDWSKGQDETGQPTLVGKANIPARNMGVDVLIRKNSDPQLPASHLMEINFRVSDSFIGGSIAGVPGVLLKNEELVQGTPLVGASARVVGNSFLFALSASPGDLTNNAALLTQRKWMDLALIYATGKRAIITLEKDPNAEKLFTEVFSAWGQTASN